MSKSSKKKSAEKRKQMKRAARAARQAQYSAWASDGMNKKSKRFTKKARNGIVPDTRHETRFCGNIACKQCFPTMSQHTQKVYTKPVRKMTMAEFKAEQRARA